MEKCCCDVLWRSVGQECWENCVCVGKCCRGVLKECCRRSVAEKWLSVVDKCWEGVLWRGVVKKCCGAVLWCSVVETCCERVL